MSSLDTDIYTGVWINRHYGRVAGLTLTLTRAHGGLLIAFLALFVGAAGRAFWRIARYVLHMWLSSESRQDGVYHQRQAILRNTQIALDAGVDLVYSRLAWRRRGRRLDLRLTSISLTAMLIAAVFVLSGIFSSSVTGGAGGEVLMAGQYCGQPGSRQGNMTERWGFDIVTQAKAWTDYYSAYAQKSAEYLSYAAKCYGSKSGVVTDECNIYTKSTLPYQSNKSAACPFDEEMCLLSKDNIFLETDVLDSYEHLGLNAGPRFQLKMKRHCAPIKVDGYSRLSYNESNSSVFWLYDYGASATRNYTHRIRADVTIPLESPEDLYFGDNYVVTYPDVFSPIPSQKEKSVAFEPISTLRVNSTLNLIFMESTNVKYYAQVKDPWFATTEAREVPSFADLDLPNNTYYVNTVPARVLGCADNLQMCNPANQKCFDFSQRSTRWNETWPESNMYDATFINGIDQYIRLVFPGTANYPQGYYRDGSLPSLKTRFTLNGLQQPAIIPPNRWQEEVEYIFQTNLAAMQARVVEHAGGGLFKGMNPGTVCGLNVECRRQCYSQKIRSPTYSSFSLLGILVILALGTVLILLGTFIDPFFSLLQKLIPALRSRRFKYAQQEWEANSTLQLQRLAHEGAGSGTWEETKLGVPVTRKGEGLGVLSLERSHTGFVSLHRGDTGLVGGQEMGIMRGQAYVRVETEEKK